MALCFNQLSPHLWVAQSRLFNTNTGVFVSEGQACLIDPGVYPDEIADIARFLEEQRAEPRSIVITHSHWDHILGPEHFPGVKVIAQARYQAEIGGRAGELVRQEIAKWEEKAGLERERPFAIPLPDKVFVQNKTLQVGALSLRLQHTPGHAGDQLVVYEPSSAALWAADQLSDLEIPYASDSLAAYQKSLDMLSRWEIRALVPGHGTPTTDPQEIHDRVFEDIAYLTTLRDKVAQAIHMGKTVEETVELCQGMPFRRPEDNAGPHQLNVESTYMELGGETETPYLGWARFLDPDRE